MGHDENRCLRDGRIDSAAPAPQHGPMTRSHHDMGGLPAGSVERVERDYEAWEKRIDALMTLLIRDRKLMRVDELRRGIEALAPDVYDRLTYYERWIASIAAVLVEKGVLDRAALEARVAEIESRGAGAS